MERTALREVPGPVRQAEASPRRSSWWTAGLLLWSVLLVLWTAALLRPEPVQLADAVLPQHVEFPVSKLLHVGAYATLAALVMLLRPLGRGRWLLLAVLSLHGMGTEYLQQFVELRGPSVRDVVLDHIGIMLGVIVAWKGWLSGR